MGRSRFRNSEATLNVDCLTTYLSGDLAYTTAIERATVKLAGHEKAAPMALRVTHMSFAGRTVDGSLFCATPTPLVAKTASETVLEKR